MTEEEWHRSYWTLLATRFICARKIEACRPPGGDPPAQRRSHICNGQREQPRLGLGGIERAANRDQTVGHAATVAQISPLK